MYINIPGILGHLINNVALAKTSKTFTANITYYCEIN